MSHFLDIIVPEYNCPVEYMKRLLNSIVCQKNVDMNEIGVIIVNDNSPQKLDQSFFDGYNSIDIRYLKKDTNGGQGLARQFGMDNSSATYVTFMDQDDMVNGTENLSLAIAQLKSNNFKVLMCDFLEEVYVDERPYYYVREHQFVSALHGIFLNREEMIKRNIRFHPNLRNNDDTYFCSLLSWTLPTYNFKVPVYLWKANMNSQTRNKNNIDYTVRTFDDFCNAIFWAYDYIEKIDYENACKFMLYSLYGALLLLRSEYFNVREQEIPFFEKQIKDNAIKIKEYVKDCPYMELQRIFDEEIKGMSRANPRIKKISTEVFVKEFFDQELEVDSSSIGIVIFNDGATDYELKRLIKLISEQIKDNEQLFEIVVLNDNSIKLKESWIKTHYPNLKISINADSDDGKTLFERAIINTHSSYITFLTPQYEFSKNNILTGIYKVLLEISPAMLVTGYDIVYKNQVLESHGPKDNFSIVGRFMCKRYIQNHIEESIFIKMKESLNGTFQDELGERVVLCYNATAFNKNKRN